MIQRLVIDDLRSELMSRPGTVYCRTADEAIALLDAGILDDGIAELSLDHDLGRDDAGNLLEIRPFIRALHALCDPDDPRPIPVQLVTIHTSNGSGLEWLNGMFTQGAMAEHYDRVRVIDSNDPDVQLYHLDHLKQSDPNVTIKGAS